MLALKIQPASPKTEIKGIREGELLMRVRGVPEKGKANKALIRYLSKTLKVSQSEINLEQGATSRHKVLCLPAESETRVKELLKEWLQEDGN